MELSVAFGFEEKSSMDCLDDGALTALIGTADEIAGWV
jgi:hypothetical protein